MNVAYARVSTQEQAKQETIENQLRLLKKQNVKLEHIFSDDGVSGTIPFEQRKGGKELLQLASSGKVKKLFISTWDRLARNLREFLNVVYELDKLGVAITCISQPIDTSTTAGRLQLHVLASFAEHERDRILERTSTGARGKIEHGGYIGGFIAFGYRKDGKGKDSKLVPDDKPIPKLKLSPVEVAKRMFNMAAEGQSCQKIANWLNAMDIPVTKQNKSGIWRPNSVRVILRNTIYKGTLVWGKNRTVSTGDGKKKTLKANPIEKHITVPAPVIVTAGQWEKANEALHRNQLLSMAHPKQNYLLRGLIVCKLCGCRYAAAGPQYRCIGRHCAKRIWAGTRPSCPSHGVRTDNLEGSVWREIEIFLAKPGAVVKTLEEQQKDQSGAHVADELKELEARLKVAKNAQAVALRQLTHELIDEAQFEAECQSIIRDRNTIEEQIAACTKRMEDSEADKRALTAAKSLIQRLRSNLAHGKLSPVQRRKIVECLVERILIEAPIGQPAKVVVSFRFEAHFSRSFPRRKLDESGINAQSYLPA